MFPLSRLRPSALPLRVNPTFFRSYTARPLNYNFNKLCKLVESYGPRHIVARHHPAEKLRVIAVPFFTHLSDLLNKPNHVNSRKFNGFMTFLRTKFVAPAGELNYLQLVNLTKNLREKGIDVCELEYLGALICVEFIKMLEAISYDYERVDSDVVDALKAFKQWSETNRDEVKKGLEHFNFLVKSRSKIQKANASSSSSPKGNNYKQTKGIHKQHSKSTQSQQPKITNNKQPKTTNSQEAKSSHSQHLKTAHSQLQAKAA